MIRGKHNSSEDGFTLVELLVATVLTGILIAVIMSFMMTTFVQTTIDSARADLLRESQQTLDIIGRSVRLSSNALDSTTLEDDFAPENGWSSDDNTIVLAVAATDRDNNVLFSDPLNYHTAGNNIIYFLHEGTLYRRTLASQVSGNTAQTSCPSSANVPNCPNDSALAHNVRSFSITYYDNRDEEVSPISARSVQLTIELEAQKFGRKLESKYTSRTVFRNE